MSSFSHGHAAVSSTQFPADLSGWCYMSYIYPPGIPAETAVLVARKPASTRWVPQDDVPAILIDDDAHWRHPNVVGAINATIAKEGRVLVAFNDEDQERAFVSFLCGRGAQ